VAVQAVLIALATIATLTSSTQTPPSAESAIRKIIADQVTAWDAGDGAAYAAAVSPDVSFTNIFGMVMYGRTAFIARHVEILSTFYKGTRKVQAIRRIRFVTADVAIVDIDNEVRGVKSLPGGLPVPADGVVKTQLMEVLVFRNGTWHMEAYHNVDVKTSAARQVPAGASLTSAHTSETRNR
jgi:uncharacterized protein (TIGR02246 family)